MNKAVKNWQEEIASFAKAMGVLFTALGIFGALVWQLYASGLVQAEVGKGLDNQAAFCRPQIDKNTSDIIQLKETQLLTYLSLKQILTDKQVHDAQKEFDEIKRRQ